MRKRYGLPHRATVRTKRDNAFLSKVFVEAGLRSAQVLNEGVGKIQGGK